MGQSAVSIACQAGSKDCGKHFTHAKLIRGYSELVKELGGKPNPMLEAAGIDPAVLDHPTATVPIRAVGEVLEATASRLGCSDFGMRLAERHEMSAVMEPLDRMFRKAPSVRHAFQGCIDHMSAYNSGLLMELGEEPETGLTLIDFKLPGGLALFPQFMEQLLLLTHASVIWLSSGFARSRTIWFSHLAVSSPATYARRFNGVVEFGQEFDGLLFSPADLAARVSEDGAEPFILETCTLARRFPPRQNEVDVRVRQTIFKMLTRSGLCTRQGVAHALGLQERTLNRHLSKKNTNFEMIRDQVRRDLALRYLARCDLSMTEVAGRLGYSEPAVLSRCCQRWFGTSPRRLRRALLAERPFLKSGWSGSRLNRLAA